MATATTGRASAPTTLHATQTGTCTDQTHLLARKRTEEQQLDVEMLSPGTEHHEMVAEPIDKIDFSSSEQQMDAEVLAPGTEDHHMVAETSEGPIGRPRGSLGDPWEGLGELWGALFGSRGESKINENRVFLP